LKQVAEKYLLAVKRSKSGFFVMGSSQKSGYKARDMNA
jgi:hypothetical protein